MISGANYATGGRGTPTDFLSFHAKGSPGFVDGHVRLGISAQLQDINRGFAMIAGVPELKDKPVVIGESVRPTGAGRPARGRASGCRVRQGRRRKRPIHTAEAGGLPFRAGDVGMGV